MFFLNINVPVLRVSKYLSSTKILKAFYGMNMHEKYSGKNQMMKQKAIDYATKKEHDKLHRFQSTDDDYSKVKPTKIQRWLLVFTRFYASQKLVPEYVPYRQICKMGDRLRIFYISFSVIVLFLVFFGMESQLHKKILRDREMIVSKKEE